MIPKPVIGASRGVITIRKVYVEEYEIVLDVDGVPIEPKCPSCHVGVDRPKCPWEYGEGCPRHDLKTAYRKVLKMVGEKG